jgi:hypothetical protein
MQNPVIKKFATLNSTRNETPLGDCDIYSVMQKVG